MVLVIDNYDSFTYNIVQYIMQLGKEVQVVRNDAMSLAEIAELDFGQIVISPGPGTPDNAGISQDIIREYAGKKPILGVCLGLQSIAAAYGGKIVSAKKIMHGKSDLAEHDGRTLFRGLPNPLRVMRYHSLVADEKSLPPEVEVSARSNDGDIMAIRHRKLRIEGVQFHPESIGAEEGMKILSNFFESAEEMYSIKPLLKKAAAGQDMTRGEAEFIMEAMSSGTMTGAQTGALLATMALKSETAEEIAGFASILREKAVNLPAANDFDGVDTCGTGGDSAGTINISTAASFVAAGAGVQVAKHGNRSITSKSGSADVLEELGIQIDLAPEDSARCLDQCGMTFMFAQKYHPAFRYIGEARRDLGFRTVFNMLGPLLNPAGAKRQVMGVFDGTLTEKIAGVLLMLGSKRALVVNGFDGLDEISLTERTRITELRDGWIKTYTFDPRQYGFEFCTMSDLKGGSPADNAGILVNILNGEKGPKRDVVVLNAAAAIIASGRSDSFEDAIVMAQSSLDSGKALEVYEKLKAFA